MSNQHKENPHIGSSFDDFLREEAILEEVTAVATKRVIAWQISEGMSSLKLSKTAMAKSRRRAWEKGKNRAGTRLRGNTYQIRWTSLP